MVAVLAIDSPILRRVHCDWMQRRRGGNLPARQDFDVSDLRYILGNLNLIDVLRDPLRFRYRVHGSNCASLLGYDMTRKLTDDYPDPSYRDRVRRNMQAVVDSRT